ncbi:hypothetical protein GQ457_12G013350 [Hibiscus cannabinus]
MGVHKAVDLQEGDGRMGEYLRVRTEIDSLKPLRRFIALGKLVDGRLRMCPVKYERLPRFFFNCGRIGHGWEMCPDKQEGFKGPFQFGDWLKVDLGKNKLNARRKPGIVYAGQTLQTKPLEGEGERLIDSQEEEDPQQGKGKTISNTNTRLRPAKRSLKGKNEVCHPIAFKKSRTANSVGGVEEKGVETSSPNIQTEPTVEAVQALRQFSAVNGPDLVFLCETRLYKNKTEQVRRQLGMVGGLEVEWSESCVGLMLLWQDTLQVTLRSYSQWHIDVMVDDGQFPFRFIGIYGSCYREKKKEVWELLDSLGQQQESPWLIGGDLNEILDKSEKEGGRRRPRVDMNEFRDALNRNGLWDIRPTVGWFTWQTGESARVFMKERLDRFAASISWLQKYEQCTINTEFTDKSDHYFLLLDTEGLCNRDRRRDDYFRFDTCWMDDDECEAKVREAWLEQSSSTLRKIKSVGSKLGPWQKAKRSSTFQKKKLLRDKIDRLMMEEISETNFEALKLAKQELKKVLDTEERYWRQRSRVQWLKAGDRNTTFFHARANGRRKKNMVKGITDKEGVWVEGTDKVIEAVETCITPDMNSKLCAGFTVEEVKRAFLQIHPNKSPGIDGLPASFFRKYWNICGHDLLTLCLDLLDGRSSWSDINRTIIVLIPKLDKPSLMKQFRPISLCTVVYKICAKAIVNRLKSIMPVCIADNQSAFVPGRLITDNFLVAHELIHYLNCAKNGPNKGAAIKLDMEKAYDRVEWHFLHDILSKMGFASGWIDIVMKCVTTVSYAIRVNGCISGTFRPTRGLRQGDPLSPYLFLFCTHGLSALLLKEQAQGKIVGVRASQRGLRVNHLLYADDCILFIKNSEREAQRLQEVLGIYEASSGQKVNVDKSSIFFSKGTSVASKARIQEILLMREELSMDNYLGLPLLVGKNKTDTLGFIPRRVDKRVLGWTKNLLSFGGRETLLKAVAQALPAYAMQVFLLPDCILDPIITTMRRYWWSGKAKERGWAHVAWKKLCTPKGEGGMGFRDLRLFNYALLGKQVWKLITCRDSLCFKVLSAKYFPSGNVLEAVPKDHSSFVWTSILRAKDKLKEGFHWRIGIDSSIAMHNQVWGGDDPVRLETTYLDNPENPVQCKDFMVEGCCQWDTHKVIQVFTAEDATKIIQCPIANSREDVLVWTHNRSGLYSTKSGHHWLANREQVYVDETPIWKAVMKARTLPKIRIFGWRLGQEALPVGKKLQEVLTCSGLDNLLPQGPYPSCKSWLEDVMQVMNPSQFRCLLVLLWNVWNRRNKWVHQNQLIPARLVSDYAQMIAAESQEDENTLSQPLQNQRAERWKKPAVGTIKVNVDGAWSRERSLAAVGIVARDHNGMVVDAMAQRKEGPHTASTIEACAFAEGVRMALQHGWPRVQIEGDAQQIVAQLKGTRLDRSVAASYLHETWASLQAQPDYMFGEMFVVFSQPPSLTRDQDQGRALVDRHEGGEGAVQRWWFIGNVSWFSDMGFVGGWPGLGPAGGDGHPHGVAWLQTHGCKQDLGSRWGVATPATLAGVTAPGWRVLRYGEEDEGSVGGAPDGGLTAEITAPMGADWPDGLGRRQDRGLGQGADRPDGLGRRQDRGLGQGADWPDGLGRRQDRGLGQGADWPDGLGRSQDRGLGQGADRPDGLGRRQDRGLGQGADRLDGLGRRQDQGLGQGAVTLVILDNAPDPGWRPARFRKKVSPFQTFQCLLGVELGCFFSSLGGSDPPPHRPPSGGARPRSRGGPRKAPMRQRCGPVVPMSHPMVPARCSDRWATAADQFSDEGVYYIFRSPLLGADEPCRLGWKRCARCGLVARKGWPDQCTAMVPAGHGGRNFSDDGISHDFDSPSLGPMEPSPLVSIRGTWGGLRASKRWSAHSTTVVLSDQGGLLTHRVGDIDKVLNRYWGSLRDHGCGVDRSLSGMCRPEGSSGYHATLWVGNMDKVRFANGPLVIASGLQRGGNGRDAWWNSFAGGATGRSAILGAGRLAKVRSSMLELNVAAHLAMWCTLGCCYGLNHDLGALVGIPLPPMGDKRVMDRAYNSSRGCSLVFTSNRTCGPDCHCLRETVMLDWDKTVFSRKPEGCCWELNAKVVLSFVGVRGCSMAPIRDQVFMAAITKVGIWVHGPMAVFFLPPVGGKRVKGRLGKSSRGCRPDFTRNRSCGSDHHCMCESVLMDLEYTDFPRKKEGCWVFNAKLVLSFMVGKMGKRPRASSLTISLAHPLSWSQSVGGKDLSIALLLSFLLAETILFGALMEDSSKILVQEMEGLRFTEDELQVVEEIEALGLEPVQGEESKVGEAVGNKFGKCIATDLRDEKGCSGEYLRVRVEIDSSRPLKRCTVLGKNAKTGQPRVCMVKYERLPRFCFYCGIIGHEFQLCPDLPKGDTPAFQFGDWLRVEPLKYNDLTKRKVRPEIVYAPKLEESGSKQNQKGTTLEAKGESETKLVEMGDGSGSNKVVVEGNDKSLTVGPNQSGQPITPRPKHKNAKHALKEKMEESGSKKSKKANHDFIKLCLDLLKGRASMVDVNQTVIVLIPKIDSPTLMKHFRPISLCTVVYKTCSKVLVNRMKPLMSCCIAENQSAFVPGRLISDNVIVANELFHYLNGSKNGPNKGAAIKLDMEKAYDRVEWHFLYDVMKKMGFADGWNKSIMMCVTTLSFCLKINGEISDFFRPSRGLRQGDPLSPYLFLFCTQGLSAMLLKDQREGRIQGVRASQKGPRINHLLYADDCLLFIKNSEKEARRLKEVLMVYEASSRQKINVEKSSIYFSNGTSEQSKTTLKSILNMNEDAVLGQYLGLPLIVGKSKMEAFKFLIENVDKRSGNWSKNLLSFGGREIFIKSVAQGIPAYAMCCFMLPDCILEPIVSTTRNFWWSGRHNERGWSHVAWHNLCKPKVAGGLGFRDLKRFNLALLAKQPNKGTKPLMYGAVFSRRKKLSKMDSIGGLE